MALQQSPVSGTKVGLMVGGLVVLVVAAFAGAGFLVPDPGPSASRPSATAPATTAPTPTPTTATATPDSVEATPTVQPSRNHRREPDADRGTPIDHGVWVEIAKGWQKESTDYLGLRVYTDAGSAAAFYISTNPVGSGPLLRPDAEAFADTHRLHGVQVGAVTWLPAPNLNIIEAGRISFTGRQTIDQATYSFGGECTRLRGAPAVNDVSVSICFVAYQEDLDAVRAEVRQMVASVARSI
jgi:hypothetical protein